MAAVTCSLHRVYCSVAFRSSVASIEDEAGSRIWAMSSKASRNDRPERNHEGVKSRVARMKRSAILTCSATQMKLYKQFNRLR
jgi:hypothetical protein